MIYFNDKAASPNWLFLTIAATYLKSQNLSEFGRVGY
jgi:hypothetical protein